MFNGIADRLGRQDAHGKICRQGGLEARGNAIGNDRIGLERQVWSMLFMRAKRQDGNHVALCIALVDHVSPDAPDTIDDGSALLPWRRT